MASDCGDDAVVLAAVQHASRRLRRCPTGMLDRRCARRAEGTQVGTTGWPSWSNNRIICLGRLPGLASAHRRRTVRRMVL